LSGKITIPTSPEAKQWSGWKTALKPAHEPIVMARKPMKGSTIDNVLEHGVGALNIDETRIPFENVKQAKAYAKQRIANTNQPDNPRKTTFGSFAAKLDLPVRNQTPDPEISTIGRYPSNVLGDIADYQRYFYSPKVSRRERHRGFEQDQIPDPLENYAQGDVKNHPLWDPSIGTNIQRLKHKILEHNRDLGNKKDPLAHIPTGNNIGDGVYAPGTPGNNNNAAGKKNKKDPLAHRPTNPEGMSAVDGTGVHDNSNKYKAVGNNHPTVKPVELMKYLVRLVTPQGSHIIDPFAGSGSTGMACRELARQFTGIELDPNYCGIARRRIAATKTDPREQLFE
jgi:site-specific DNA-methyltransferase (adenine-specific)